MKPRAPHVTIDARLSDAGGIGTYLSELLPRVLHRWEEASFTLLGSEARLAPLALPWARTTIRPFDLPIYSAAEQLAFVRALPRQTSLVWSPHYNIPLAHSGVLAVTVHDVNHLALPQSLAKRLYARSMFGAVRRRAQMVLFDSHFTEGEFTRRVGLPRNFRTVHLGVAPRWFSLASATERAPPYFLFVGNIKPHKNLPALLSAFERLPVTLPHRLVIVGRREGFITGDGTIAALAKQLGDRVDFTGHVSEDELGILIGGCDALILPSLYEGFGLPPLEALAAGRAVGVSRSSSLPEVCGEHAEYFDPADVSDLTGALSRLARRPADGDDLRERRRSWARRFDWERCADETLGALRSTLA